ncbi:MAG TPA: GNAT family N-acetyltransferase [Nocardioides sp.]|jgi:GNAT superfamily N-acetyltransferase|uniref:GNAT family N-acetyltransferase n=1 Tax=Nocardioides sp. TaxID=35761 RepID=UPI002E365792|nr:GNAT family N-acetyltransferase [Nocardioides sp.]HEX3930274.1 GNAT family N-acetyltransferase [Nocardioides sp.]
MSTLDLPDPLTSRVLSQADAEAVYELAAAQEQADIGRVEVELADILSDWSRPSWDVATHTLGVFDGDRMVAYGEITGADRGDAAVHPDYRRRGIGTAVAGWMRQTALDLGGEGYGSPVPQGSAGDRLLDRLGYRVRWTSWVLDLPEGTEVAPRALPPGYAVRGATPDDYHAIHDVIEDAFLEWSVRERESYEDYHASVIGRPGFEPWNLRVVTDPSGEVVGAAVVLMFAGPPPEAFIERLAVRRDQRRQGLAQALLADAFAEGRSRGATRQCLSTDSRTGALSLYEKVGMVVGDVWLNRATGV